MLRYWVLVLGLITFAGCHSESPDASRFTPSSELARRALTAVLTERTTGKTSPELRADLPNLHIIDTHEKPGETLSEFHILGERPSDTGRMFVVELTFHESESPRKASFVVVGIDPLLIFREEDLAMVAHWDHVMTEPQAPSNREAVEQGTPHVD